MFSENVRHSQSYHVGGGSIRKWSYIDILVSLPIIFIMSYIFSIQFSELYYDGDQKGYREFYRYAYRFSLSELPKFQNSVIGAGEPIFGLIIWVGSVLGIEKNFYMSVFNAILCAEIFLLLRKYRVGYLFITLSLTNYYLFVLLFAAERLKFGFIFLLAAGLVSQRIAWAFLFMSCLSHFQMIISISSLIVGKLIGSSSSIFGSLRGISYVYYIIGILAAYFIYREYVNLISEKAIYYYDSYFSYIGAAELTILFLIGLINSKNKREMIGVMLISIASVVFLGNIRGNMIGVINWLWVFIRENRTLKLAVIAIMLYFSVKSYSFLFSVVNFGHGFDESLMYRGGVNQ